MIYFWRIVVVFGIFNLISIITLNGSAGMRIVWVAIIIGSLVLSFKKPFHFLFSNKYFKLLFLGVCLIFVIIEGVIVFQGIGFNTVNNCDYLIVLGARVRGETPSLTLKYRLDVAYDYLSKNPDTQAILAGGQGEGENISEAEAMKRYLVKKGISVDRLMLENQSRDTVENLKYSFRMIDTSEKDLQIIVATSRFHILRSKMIAHDLGCEVNGIGAKTLPYLIPTYYLREFFAVVEEIFF